MSAPHQGQAAGEAVAFDAWIASTGLRISPHVRECMRSAWNVRAALANASERCGVCAASDACDRMAIEAEQANIRG